MTTAILVVVGLVSLLVLLLYGATIELYRQVLQIRKHMGLVDDARPLDFNGDTRLSDLPIPYAQDSANRHLGASDEDDATTIRRAVLLLSDTCATCAEVARNLDAKMTGPGLMAVLESRSASDATNWLNMHGLRYSERLVYDENSKIAELLGVSVTPAVVRFEGVYPTEASTVPSERQLDVIGDWLAGAGSPLGFK